MSIIHKVLPNQIDADENVLRNDATLSHTLTLVAYVRRSEITKFGAYGK